MRALAVRGILIALLLTVAASASWAMVGYANDPPFEPQRTLFWNFSNSDWQTPITAAGPTWGEGDWASDSVTTLNVNWYDTSVWAGRQGFIGCDNTNGQSTVNGRMAIHVNNFDIPNPVKHLWFEVEVTQWGDVTSEGVFTGPNGATVSFVNETQELVDGGMRLNALWDIHPNPAWETFTWTFEVPAGAGIIVDKFYLSTACVPEPSALMALGTGLIGLAGLASRRRRA